MSEENSKEKEHLCMRCVWKATKDATAFLVKWSLTFIAGTTVAAWWVATEEYSRVLRHDGWDGPLDAPLWASISIHCGLCALVACVVAALAQWKLKRS